MRPLTDPARGSGRDASVRGRVAALAGRARSPLAALALLLAALAALALAAWRADGVPPDAREEPSEPRFIFRFKVPTTRQTAGNVAAVRPAEHEAPKLSEAEMAKRQADVSEYLGEVKRGGRALDRTAFLEIYRRAGTFHVIHALLDTGVIDKTTSSRLGELRADLHQEVLDTMARSGKFGRRIGVNDFGSGAMTAKSDIDFTLYCDDPSVAGTDLVEEYSRIYKSLSGGLAPGSFDLVAHRWEATIPDWRASCAEADFVQKLRTGTQLLKANPEAYFLEGAYAQQILRRSAEGRTFTWIEKMPDGSLDRQKVNAAAETPFFYRPDTRVRYAWGAAVGNWHFFNAHSHDRIAQAKYLLRSFDDGVSLTSRGGKTADYARLTPLQRKNLVVEIYRGHPEAAGRYLAILETAVKIRELKSTGREAFAPLMEWERRQAGGMEIDDDLALKMAEESLVRDGNRMLLENNRIAAEGRLADWVAPNLPPGKYRTYSDTGQPRLIDVDAGLVKRLQLAAFFEIRDGIERMDRAEVEKIKNDNPRFKKDIEILQRLIEKQRQMALAPEDLDAKAAREYRRSLADIVLKDFDALPAVARNGGVRGVISHVWDLGNKVEERVQRNTIDALAYHATGKNPRVVVGLKRLRLLTSGTNERLISSDWMGRMDKASSLVEIANVYLKEGELNQKVLEAIFWQGVTFLPGGGTYMSLTSGAGGVVTLVSTKLIPGYGPLLITLQLTKGVVELGMLAIFEPLQRDRLLLAYQGYLPPTGGGWVTLSTGQKFEVQSPVPSILELIAGPERKDLDARREAVYDFFHRRVTEAISRDPDFPFTEEELPSEWADREQRLLPELIQAYVHDWFHQTGDFASYDELAAFCGRLAGEAPAAFREQLGSLLFKDYYTGKSRALQRKFQENESEQQQIGSLHRQVGAVNAGLDAVAAGMSADFAANGDAIQAWCLDEMPTVPPSMEILAAPRVVDLEVEGEREKVRAVPQVGFRAKVWASEKEFPGPWKVRWEVRRGGETVAFDPGKDLPPLEAKVGETVGTDSSRVDVVATATDATGRQIVSASVPLEVEKVKLGEDRPEEPDAEEARDGTGAGTGAGAGSEVGGLVEEMERTAGAATAAANEASEACRAAAAAGRSVSEKAAGLTGEVDGLAGAIGALEGRASTVAGLGTAVTAALARANALSNEIAPRRDLAGALRQKACAGADALAGISASAERERVVAEIAAASFELDRLEGEAGNLLASLRREVETARRGSEELDALLAELARLDERVRAAGEAASGLPAMVEEAEGRLEKARAALDKVATQQANGVKLVEDAKRSAAAAGGGPEAAAAVKKATELAAAIRTRGKAVAPCADAAAASDVTPAATAARDVAARAGELTSRLEGVRRTVGEGGLRERLRGNAAEATSLLELCGTFVESIRNRAADARACLARARSAIAAPVLVAVPDLVGKTRAMAEAWLGDLGLSPVVTTGDGAPPSGEPGRVASQTHPAGSRIPAGSFVGVTVWGPRAAAAPVAPPALPVPPAPLVPPAPAGLTQADCARDWPGTVLSHDPATGTARCQCPSGSAWSKVSRACLSLPVGVAGGAGGAVAGGDCRHMPGTMRDSRTGECRCALGTWDASLGRCVDTGAAAREADVAAKRAAADCENLFSRIRILRSNPDALSRNLATQAESEARAKGCDAGRIAEATGGGAGGGSDRDSPVVPVTGPVEDKHEGEARVSSRNVNVCIIDVNDVLDDHYELFVNGGHVGGVANPEGGATCYGIVLRSGPNDLVLKLVATRGKNTFLKISINNDEFSGSFGGSKNHVWRVMAP